jgi:hypothetical protein
MPEQLPISYKNVNYFKFHYFKFHKRFTVEQVKVLLQSYVQGTIARAEVEAILQINKTHFFAILKGYRQDPESFSIAYQRETPARLSAEV